MDMKIKHNSRNDGDGLQLRPVSSTTSLPQRVCQTLRAEIIARLQPGDKLPGLRQMCGQLEVSINTLLTAVDLLARDGLVEKRHGSGIYVCEDASRWRVGILSELDLFDHRIGPQFRALAGGLRMRLAELGMMPQVYMGHAEPGLGASDEPTCPQFWEDAARGDLAGAVLLDVPSTDAWFGRIYDCPVPVVGALTPYTAGPDLDSIARAAVARLAEQGCQRLGLISWHGEAAFIEAVKRHGLTTGEAWMRTDLDPAVRGAGWEEFREIWSARGGRPDGLVILDDMLAADAQLAILELGVRIPQDLRLAIFASRGVSPPIRLPATFFEVDPEDAVNALADLMMKRLRGELTAPVELLTPFRECDVRECVSA